MAYPAITVTFGNCRFWRSANQLRIDHYRALGAVDWCPTDNTTLAREQVVGPDRVCERCGTPVIKKDLEQWFFRITRYADELLDFSKMDWPERVKTMQRNWIGRSEGAEIVYTSEQGDPITVFTTRPDTLFGATFLVLAPEHPLVEKLTTPEHRAEVTAYVRRARRQTEIERLAEDREKTGVFIGAYARHPLTNARIPIYIGDYVLLTYGTGAIHAVPAHDSRDFAFAGKYGLPIPVVIAPLDWDGKPLPDAYVGEGVMVNSGPLDGTPSEEGRRRDLPGWGQAAADQERSEGDGKVERRGAALRAARRVVADLHVVPADAAAPARAQAFEDRFLRGPAPREVLGRLLAGLAIADLPLRVNAVQEDLAVLLDHPPDA